MGVRTYRELVAWQLSRELRDKIVALAATERLARERSLCEQIVDAASSAPRNIAEGFGRYSAREFARFLAIARASLLETEVHLEDALTRHLITPTEHQECQHLLKRAFVATSRLLRSVQQLRDPTRRT